MKKFENPYIRVAKFFHDPGTPQEKAYTTSRVGKSWSCACPTFQQYTACEHVSRMVRAYATGELPVSCKVYKETLDFPHHPALDVAVKQRMENFAKGIKVAPAKPQPKSQPKPEWVAGIEALQKKAQEKTKPPTQPKAEKSEERKIIEQAKKAGTIAIELE